MKKTTLYTWLYVIATIPCVWITLWPIKSMGRMNQGRVAAFAAISSAFVYAMVREKNRECEVLLEKIKRQDSIWDPVSIKKSVTFIYDKVHQAWMSGDFDTLKSYASDKFIAGQKNELRGITELDKKRIVKPEYELQECKVVQVADYTNDARDAFTVWLKVKRARYVYWEKSGSLDHAQAVYPQIAEEVWTFVRAGEGWVLDEIRDGLDPDNYLGKKTTFSEGNG